MNLSMITFFLLPFLLSELSASQLEKNDHVDMERVQGVERLWLQYRELYTQVYERSRAHPMNQSRPLGITMLSDGQYEEAKKRYDESYWGLNKLEEEEWSKRLKLLLYIKKS